MDINIYIGRHSIPVLSRCCCWLNEHENAVNSLEAEFGIRYSVNTVTYYYRTTKCTKERKYVFFAYNENYETNEMVKRYDII